MDCVHRATNVEEADIVVAWLAEREIAAFVNNRNMAGNFVSMAVAPKGVEVCVADPDQANRARELLQAHCEEPAEYPLGDFEKIIPIQCTECGSMLEYPGEFTGTIQACPNCGTDVNVGDSPRFC